MRNANRITRRSIALAFALLLAALTFVRLGAPVAEAQTPPDAPSFVFATTQNDGSISAWWLPVSGATKYAAAYTGNDGATWTDLDDNITSTRFRFTPSDVTRSHVVRVRAGNGNGWSGWKGSNATLPFTDAYFVDRVVSIPKPDPADVGKRMNIHTPAPPPTSISVSGVTATTGRLNVTNPRIFWSWRYSGGDCNYGGNSEVYSDSIAGLSPGTSYSVNAYASIECSGQSIASTAFTTPSVTLSASNVSTSTATLTLSGNWDLVKDGGWYYKGVAVGANLACTGPVSNQRSVNLTGLTPDKTYTVTAYNAAQCVGVVATTSLTTLELRKELSAANVSTSTATLNLTNVPGTWYYKRVAGPSNSTCNTASGGTAALSGLQPNAWYGYSVYSDSGCSTTLLDSAYFSTHMTVDNFAETPYQYNCLISGNSKCAVGFTTGPLASGYTLASVTARFASSTDPNDALGDMVATLHGAMAGPVSPLVPASTTLATLSGSNPEPQSTAEYAYTCSGSGCALSPNTLYFVQFAATAGSDISEYYQLQGTESDGQDLVPSGIGWDLEDGTDYYRDTNWPLQYPDVGFVRVAAVSNPTLTASAVASSTATLTLWHHDADWWLKRVAPATTTCESMGRAETKNLTGLTADTFYAYGAYSDSGCSSEVDAAFFSTADFSVGNLAETDDYFCRVGSAGAANRCAVAFTTGTNADGYALDSVTARFGADQATPGNISVAIHAADTSNASNPAAASLATLSGSNPSTAGLYTYECSTNCDLAASTAYFVVMQTTDTSGIKWYTLRTTNSDDEAKRPAANGWSIADAGRLREGSQAWKNVDSASSTPMVHIAASVKPPPPELTAGSVTSSAATLALANYTGTWYSKRIHPDPTTAICSVAVSGPTQVRDSLTTDTTYAYTAYSDANCTAANALDTAYFSTTDAAVGNLAEARESASWSVGGTSNVKRANAFTTGGQSFGYVLTGVTLDFGAKTSSPGDISVALHAADTGNASNPATTAAATLSGSDPDSAGLQTYTCSGSGCELSASTTYFIVTSVPAGYANGSYNQRNTASDDETLQSPATGWTIADAGRSKTGTAAWTAAGQSAAMHIAANVKPAILSVSDITGTGAMLTIANHTGNWHHKETFPATTTCSAANANATTTLASLTANKTYAYTAYSDANCTAANALDTAYFSTTGNGVGNLDEVSDFYVSVGTGYFNQWTTTFTTGSSPAGYTLSGVTLRFNDKFATGTPGAIQVTLRESHISRTSPPSEVKATLSGSNPDTAGLYTYTCSTGCELAATTTYYVVVAAPSATGGGFYTLAHTQADAELKHPAGNGWSIGNQGQYKSQRTGWRNSALSRAINMHVAANVKTEFSVSGISSTTATLTFSGLDTWHYKRVAGPSDTSCNAASSPTVPLSGLATSTFYGYSAYSDSGCATTALDTVYFSTTDLEVGNLDTGDDFASVGNVGSDRKLTAAFTTGKNAGGYTLTGVTLQAGAKEGSPTNIVVAVHTADTSNSANPASTAKATLSGSNPDTAGLYSYTCSTGCDLAASTTYFVVASAPTAGSDTHRYRLRITKTDSETSRPSDNGWSIADEGRDNTGNTGWGLLSESRTVVMHVAANAKASLAVTAVGTSTATLAITSHSGAWYYKRVNGPSDTTCNAVSVGTTAALSGLATSTFYGYSAYGDSGCATTALDTAYFSTTDVEVHNLGTDTVTGAFGNTFGTDAKRATAFTTGVNAGGYTLTGVTMPFTDKVGSPANIVVAIHAAASNGINPANSAKATLSGSNPDTAGLYSYTCSSGCDLAASTTYFVVLSATTAGHNAAYYQTRLTATDGETPRPSGNSWSIANEGRFKFGSQAWQGYSNSETGVLHLAANVKGSVPPSPTPTLTASNVSTSTATLNLANYSGSWYFQADKGFYSVNCNNAGSAASFYLGYERLSKRTTYVVTAYSDRNCTNAISAPLTFTTTGVVISFSRAGATTTMAIAGHTGNWWYKADKGPHATCQGPESGTTKELSGLTDGQTYTYTAYGAASCPDANALDTATFANADVAAGNLAETPASATCSIGFDLLARQCATAFTTGANAQGYTLSGVTALFDAKIGSPGDIVVGIHADNGGQPAATALVTLSGANPDTAGPHTFTCSGSGCDLASSTTYHVVMSTGDTSGSERVYLSRLTLSDADTLSPANNGWAIANNGLYKRGGGAWQSMSRGRTGMIQIAANLKAGAGSASLTASNVGATSATLAVAGYSGAWYYQLDDGSGGSGGGGSGAGASATGGAFAASSANQNPPPNCIGPVQGSTTTATHLGSNTSYTVNVYANQCQGAAMASGSFATIQSTILDPKNVKAYRGYDGARAQGSRGVMDVVWDAVSNATGYKVAYTSNWHDFTETSVSTTSARLTGFDHAGYYWVRVQAVGANNVTSGWGWSSISYAAIDPRPVYKMTLTRADAGLNVSWKQCNVFEDWCSGGTPVTGFQIDLSDDGGTTWSKAWEAKPADVTVSNSTTDANGITTGDASATVCGADNAKGYRVRIGITNRMGTSWSLASAASSTVGTYTPTPGARYPCEDFDTLNAAGNVPSGLWADGVTMWSLDYAEDKIYAYDMTTKARDASKDIALVDKTVWYDITSDGTTMWMSESSTLDRLYAYDVNSRARAATKDFMLDSANDWARGIWTDGVTMYVFDHTDDEIYAYALSTQARDSGKDITPHSDNGAGEALWSDGVTMWVVDSADDKAYAYRLSDGAREPAKDYNGLSAHVNGIWSDGATVWAAEGGTNASKIYAYHSIDPALPIAAPATVNAYRGFGFVEAEWSAVEGATGYNVEHYHPWNQAREGRAWITVATSTKATSTRVSRKNWPGDVIRVQAVRRLNARDVAGAWTSSAPVPQVLQNQLAASNVVVSRSAGKLHVSWTQCDVTTFACHGGTPITHWLINVSANNGATWTNVMRLTSYTSGAQVTLPGSYDDSKAYKVSVGIVTRFRTVWAEATTGTKRLDVSDIGENSATLTIGGYTAGWWHKRIHGPANATCTPVGAGTSTAALDSLSADTLYGYTAYSAAGCSSANALATAYFSTTDVGAGNLGSGNADAYVGGSARTEWTNAFTTGAHPDGYDLSGVTLEFAAKSGSPGDIVVTVHTASASNSSEPNATAKYTLSGSNPDTAGLYTYDCPANTDCVLSPNSAYYVSVKAASSTANAWYTLRLTSADAETLHPAANGWSIANTARFNANRGGNWKDDTQSEGMVMHLAADELDPHVTNLATPSTGDSNITSGTQQAVDFTTGPNRGGYTLESATIAMRLYAAGTGTLAVTLHAVGINGKPATSSLAALTGKAATSSSFTNTLWTCSGAGCELASSTKYYIVATLTGTGTYPWSFASGSGTESTEPSGSGWDIGLSHFRNTGSAWNSWNDLHRARIDFTIKRSLDASSITDTGALLTLDGYDGQWWIRSDVGFHSTECLIGSTGAVPSNLYARLDKRTTYTFTAYGDSGCANALASETFTTTGVALSFTNVASTTATLNIAGHTGPWWYKADTGPDNTCTRAATDAILAGVTESLTGLTEGVTYTYTAYDANGCADADALDTATLSTSDVSAGNLGASSVGMANCTIGFRHSTRKCASSFTTGANSAGYTLKSMTARFDDKRNSPSNLVVALHAADTATSSHPAASATVTLSGANPDTAGLYTYTCSGAGCDLAASTTYFIVMSNADVSGDDLWYWQTTASDEETLTPAANGWSIADGSLLDTGSGWGVMPRYAATVMHLAADLKE